MTENTVHFISPGQVHLTIGRINASGWVLAVDAMLVKDECKEVFERGSLFENEIKLSKDEINDLKNGGLTTRKRLFYISVRYHNTIYS